MVALPTEPTDVATLPVVVVMFPLTASVELPVIAPDALIVDPLIEPELKLETVAAPTFRVLDPVIAPVALNVLVLEMPTPVMVDVLISPAPVIVLGADKAPASDRTRIFADTALLMMAKWPLIARKVLLGVVAPLPVSFKFAPLLAVLVTKTVCTPLAGSVAVKRPVVTTPAASL